MRLSDLERLSRVTKLKTAMAQGRLRQVFDDESRLRGQLKELEKPSLQTVADPTEEIK